MPSFARITCAKEHDVKTARTLALNPGSIVAMDRAYNDYQLFGKWTAKGIYFVTLQKDNAKYKTVKNLPVPKRGNIISDKIIKLTGVGADEKCPYLLRRIVGWDEENQRPIVLLTNHLEFGPTTIAAIYKDRWEIELFFKALKQNLKVKSFVGTSENALRIQIWTALIAILILKWLHYISKAGWSLSNLATMLRLNLFTYRDLTEWLHNPFGTEPIIPQPEQLYLPISGLGQPRPVQKGVTST
jgi:IS4 transposase